MFEEIFSEENVSIKEDLNVTKEENITIKDESSTEDVKVTFETTNNTGMDINMGFLNSTKNLNSNVLKYLELRYKLMSEFKVKKVQENVKNKLFNMKVGFDDDILFYNEDNYVLNEEEMDYYSEIENEVDVLGHKKFRPALKENEEEIEEKENYGVGNVKNNNEGLVDIEAYCSDEDYSNSADYSNSEELNDFVVHEKEEPIKMDYNAVKMEVEENHKEMLEIERMFEKKFENVKKVKQVQDKGQVLENNLDESSASSAIEEFDFRDSESKQEETFVEEATKHTEKLSKVEHLKENTKNLPKTKSFLEKYKNNKNAFKGFK